jgi:integrase
MSRDALTAQSAPGQQWFYDFVSYKRGIGYVYSDDTVRAVRRLADALSLAGPMSVAASKQAVEAFCAPRDGESWRTRQIRAGHARQFMLFLHQRGHDCWVPPPNQHCGPRTNRFTPRIITEEEMARIIAQADQRPVCVRRRASKPVFSMMIRLLWSCGLRTGEARALTVADVDVESGCVTIRRAKNDKTRLVPMSASLTRYAASYIRRSGLDRAGADGFFFPSVHGGGYSKGGVAQHIKKIMGEAGVFRDDGSPPRVHDIRHSFAVATLAKMQSEGMDIYTSLPLLSTFMGHGDIRSTEYYLRLTRPEFPAITEAMAEAYQGVFPEPDGK